MPLPQLNTTGADFSNALYRLAESERQRQEQADISSNRKLQTDSLIENRKVDNALKQMQINRETAEGEKARLDLFHTHLSLADPTNEEDWNAFSEYERKNSKATIPVPRKADGTFDSEAAARWRDNKLDAAAYLKTGNRDIEEISLQKDNPDGTYQTMTYSKKKKDRKSFEPEKVFGKGWHIVDKFVNPKAESKKENRYYPTEQGYTTQPEGKMPFRADRQPAPLPTKDWVKIGTDILANADKPEVISEMVDMYNNESPNNVVMIPMTHKVKQKISSEDRTFPWSSKEEEVDKVLVTKIDLNKYGLSKQPLIKYANDRGIPLNQVIDAAIKVKTRKGTKK
jgi:hypothetical protein